MNEAFLCACFVPCYYWWLKYEDAILACKYFLQKAGSCEIHMKLSFYNALKMSVFLYFKGIFFVIFVTCEFFMSVILCIWQKQIQ